MNIAANGRIIATATKNLTIKWAETRDSWQDTKAREFEQKYLGDLVSGVERSAASFEDLEKLLTKIRTQCE